jgi:hypothetical protein
VSPLERRELEALIPQTLQHAAQAPFYRRTWGRRWQRVRALADLAALPLLDKTVASRHQAELIVGTRPPGIGAFSSGTTRGEAYIDPLHVPLSPEEIAARVDAAPADGEDDWPGWTLSVVSVHHGLPRTPPGAEELRVPWLHDANALSMLETILRSPQPDGRRVTAMTIGSGPLKVFSAWLEQRGVDPRGFGVKLIGTASYRLSSHWRALIESRFDAKIFDNYSLSELGTPFTDCSACGWLHMGHPPLAVELLALDTDRPVTRGPGRLVFTTLFPFTQVMPLIRYDSGDVGEFGPVCAATKQRGLRVLGRLRHGVTMGARFVLNPVDVREVLERHPEVSRTLHPMTRLGHVSSPDLGPPRWNVSREGTSVQLQFETRFDPAVYPTHARALEAHVKSELFALDAATRALGKRVHVTARAAVAALVERYD